VGPRRSNDPLANLMDRIDDNRGGESSPSKPFKVDRGQLGRKLGKHTQDFGLDPSDATHRTQIVDLIDGIGRYSERSVPGTFRGQGPGGARGPVEFRIKGRNVVVTIPGGEFVTILNDGIKNLSVVEATKDARS